MTLQQAIQTLDNLRRAVLTVSTQNGIVALSGADHDNLRDAINLLKEAHPEKKE